MEMKEKLLGLIGKDISIETTLVDNGRLVDYNGKLLEVGEDYIMLQLINEAKLTKTKMLFPFHSILTLSGYSEEIV
jgi:ferredoxin-fold anticodon binding domain-containing protein